MKKYLIAGLALMIAIALIFIGAHFREIPLFLKIDMISQGHQYLDVKEVYIDLDNRKLYFDLFFTEEAEKYIEEETCLIHYNIDVEIRNTLNDNVIFSSQKENWNIAKERTVIFDINDSVYYYYKNASETTNYFVSIYMRSPDKQQGGLGMGADVILIGQEIGESYEGNDN